jgi:hypothetical protein
MHHRSEHALVYAADLNPFLYMEIGLQAFFLFDFTENME